MFKKIIITLFFIFMFLSPLNVFAIQFVDGSDKKICYSKTDYSYKYNYWDNCTNEGGEGTYIIYEYDQKKKERTNEVYCTDREFYFAKNTTYILDTDFQKLNNCIYYEPNKDSNGKKIWYKKTDGDCSMIAAYVVKAGRDNVKKKNSSAKDTEIWFGGQAALWTYLGKYAPKDSYYKTNNDVTNFVWNKNNDVKNSIYSAWENYSNTLKKMGGITSNDNFNDILDVVYPSGNKQIIFRYKPNGSSYSCGANGVYITENITLKNKKNKAVNIEISPSSDFVSICDDRNNCSSPKESKIINLSAKGQGNDSVKIYMKSDKSLKNNPSFSIEVSYEEKVDVTVYDSKRYRKKSKNDVQGLLKLNSSGDEGKIQHIASSEISADFVTVKRTTCSPNTDKVTNNIFSKRNEDSPVNKVCASKLKDVSEVNPSDYEVNFSDCHCMSIMLDENKMVNILVKEKVYFKFGTLNPEFIYPGGGFKFFDSEDKNNNVSGVTTKYRSVLEWQYADYVVNSSGDKLYPYLYDSNNLEKNNANDYEKIIKERIKNNLKKEVVLNISTYDSNDGTKTDRINKEIKLNLAEVGSFSSENNYKFVYDVDEIKMPFAYFSANGDVFYDVVNTNNYMLGGNKYYVPLNYVSNVFPFDIVNTELSVLENADSNLGFYYGASCGVEVDIEDGNLYNKVRYRSIDLSNPFPKSIMYNWVNWYGDGNNRVRLKSTLDKFPHNPLYQITLDSGNLNEINNLTSYYTDWNNINLDGSSEFVLKNDRFDNYSSNKSYCGLGVFSKKCDG